MKMPVDHQFLVSEAVKLWLSDCHARGLKTSTINFYRDTTGLFIKAYESVKLADITPAKMLAVMSDMRNRGLSSSYIHHLWRVMRSFTTWAFEMDILPTSPLAKLRAPRVERKIMEPLTNDQVSILLGSISKNLNTFSRLRDTALLYVLLDTACRKAEVLRMTRDCVDTEMILLTNTKSRKDRHVFVTPTTRLAIVRYLNARTDQHPELWVTNTGTPLTDAGLRQILRRATATAGVRAGFHTFRRTSATALVENGASTEAVRRILGHSSLTTTTLYLGMSDTALQEQHAGASIVNRLQKTQR